MEGGRYQIYGSGQIVAGDIARLREFIREHVSGPAVIALNSPRRVAIRSGRCPSVAETEATRGLRP